MTLFVQKRDPIPTFRTWALEQGLLSDGKVKDIEAAVNAEVEDAVKFADESPKPASPSAFLVCHSVVDNFESMVTPERAECSQGRPQPTKSMTHIAMHACDGARLVVGQCQSGNQLVENLSIRSECCKSG